MTKANLSRPSLGEHLDIYKASIWTAPSDKAEDDMMGQETDPPRDGVSFPLGPEFGYGRGAHKCDGFRRWRERSAQHAQTRADG